MKLLIAAISMAIATQASAWDTQTMNTAIDQTNFIVGKGCSGTLISIEHRLILTNYHCIGAGITHTYKERVGKGGVVDKVKVEELRDMDVSQKSYSNYRLVGEASYKSQIVARWKESDLALLQIRADIPQTMFSPVFAGDSVMRGEEVTIVGNPLGLDASVTRGVISSTNRMFRVPWADAEVPFIQIDAGIAGGNSGGALYNSSGELIGVPAARASDGHLGLAIPYFRVQEFLTEHCYAEVWKAGSESHEDCVASKEAEDEE